MNLSGHWLFFEEFYFGYDRGVAVLRQKGNVVYGALVYTEHIYDEGEFTIAVDVKGIVEGTRITFEGLAYQMVDADDDFEYFFDDRDGVIVAYDRIEGGSIDEQGVEGSFTLTRII